MVLFGGIYEITKELNDFMLYDFSANRWVTLFEESASPKKLPSDMSFEEGSPHERSPKKGVSPIQGKNSISRKQSPPKSQSK